MPGLRLQDRSQKLNITVRGKVLSDGQNVESDIVGLENLVATRQPMAAEEMKTRAGKWVQVTESFFFQSIAGVALPDIKEEHVLVDGSGIRYEIFSVTKAAGENDNLVVMCNRAK